MALFAFVACTCGYLCHAHFPISHTDNVLSFINWYAKAIAILLIYSFRVGLDSDDFRIFIEFLYSYAPKQFHTHRTGNGHIRPCKYFSCYFFGIVFDFSQQLIFICAFCICSLLFFHSSCFFLQVKNDSRVIFNSTMVAWQKGYTIKKSLNRSPHTSWRHLLRLPRRILGFHQCFLNFLRISTA